MGTPEFESLEGVNPAAIRHFGDRHDWIEQGDNLLLFGAGGVGKTHVAAVDRLIHHGNIIELKGEDSYRRKAAHRRHKAASETEVD